MIVKKNHVFVIEITGKNDEILLSVLSEKPVLRTHQKGMVSDEYHSDCSFSIGMTGGYQI